jgi:hypothetical protein
MEGPCKYDPPCEECDGNCYWSEEVEEVRKFDID